MDYVAVALITLGSVNIITLIIACFDEEKALYFALGAAYWIAIALIYPIRAWRYYSRSRKYFERHGISRIQYLFGKRVK